MDRFIEDKNLKNIATLLPLKSNMDRFIGIKRDSFVRGLRTLKSNMDRFIGEQDQVIRIGKVL